MAKNNAGRRFTASVMAALMTFSSTVSTNLTTFAAETESSAVYETETVIDESGTVLQSEETSIPVETVIETVPETAATEVVTEAPTEAPTETPTTTPAPETTVEATTATAAPETTVPETVTTAAEVTTPAPTETETQPVTEPAETSGESAEDTSANETRGPDETTEALTEESAVETTIEESSEEESTEAETEEESTEEESSEESFEDFDLDTASKEEILKYIDHLGAESDAYYEWLRSLDEDHYILVWIARFGSEEDILNETYGFDYDNATDVEIVNYLAKLEEDEFADFKNDMTFEQFKRYMSIMEMVEEMRKKNFDEDAYTEDYEPDVEFNYSTYEEFASAMAGVSLKRTGDTMDFYNTLVGSSNITAGTSIDSLLDPSAESYDEDYILSLDPYQFVESSPVYYGSDGNYYVVSAVPCANGLEVADYQPASSYYNGAFARAFTDVEYLGNGVFRMSPERYKECFTETYYSLGDGGVVGVTLGFRIQVMYGYDLTADNTVTVTADVIYPDMTEKLLPARVNTTTGMATVKVFKETSDETVGSYAITSAINKGEYISDSVSVAEDGKGIEINVGDGHAVAYLDVMLGYDVDSKYSSSAEVSVADLFGYNPIEDGIATTATLADNNYVLLSSSSVPSNLAVGDKYVYANIAVYMAPVNTITWHDGNGVGYTRVGANNVATHNAQSFAFYNNRPDSDWKKIKSWFVNNLKDASSPDPDTVVPGVMVQMTSANIAARAASNGQLPVLANTNLFGYLTQGISSIPGVGTDGSRKTLNLEGTQILLSCMHAWVNESATTPSDVVNSITSFTERTGATYAPDEWCGTFHPNLVLQCTSVQQKSDGYTYATFKAVTSMLAVGGVYNAKNYQCSFSTIRIKYATPAQKAYVTIHKNSTNPSLTNGNSKYSMEGIRYGIYSDAACTKLVKEVTLDKNGEAQAVEMDISSQTTFYVKETYVPSSSGYKMSSAVTHFTLTAGLDTKVRPYGHIVTDEPIVPPSTQTGYLKLHKNSANATVTNGNACYSFTGIKYTVYSDSACTKQVGELTLDKNGDSNTIQVNIGTYYIKETYVPSGSGFAKNSSVITANVTSSNTTQANAAKVTTSDAPLNDPFGVIIYKIAGNGATADLSGAEYTIKYYAGQYTYDNLPSSPTTTWVIKTVKTGGGNYRAMLHDANIVSGSAVYGKNKSGYYMIPLGTITVQETKAPTGFSLNGATMESAKTGAQITARNNVYLFNLVDSNSAVYLKNGNNVNLSAADESGVILQQAEKQNAAGLSIQKIDSKTGTNTPSEGASLAGIRFAVTDKSTNKVVAIMTTNAGGVASTSATALAIGEFAVSELRSDATVRVGDTLGSSNQGTSKMANDYYLWSDQTKTVSITDADAGKTKRVEGTFSNTPVSHEGYLKIHKESAETAITDGNSSYSFEGIKYTVYSDEACTTKVSELTLGKSGYSSTIKLEVGTYYIRETYVPSGSGYAADTSIITATITENNTTEATALKVSVKDTPLYDQFGLILYKYSSSGTAEDLSGAEYTINYYAGQYTSDNLPSKPTTTWVIKTVKTGGGNYRAMLHDANIVSGSAVYGKDKSTGYYKIPLGTITLQETKAPKGFDINGDVLVNEKSGSVAAKTNGVYLFNLVEGDSGVYLKHGNSISTNITDEVAVRFIQTEVQHKAGLSVTKADATTGTSTPASSELDLVGIRFAITDNATGKVAAIITTDSTGYAATSADALKIGDYTISELRADATVKVGEALGSANQGSSALANETYLWSSETRTISFTDADNGKVKAVSKAFTDQPLTATPSLKKYDSELGKAEAMSGTDFAGITFNVINELDEKITVGGKTYAKGDVIDTAVSDKDGNVTFTAALPLGRYSVEETTGNAYYNVNTEKQYFNVEAGDGKAKIVYANDAASVIISDRVVRGNVKFVKNDAETGKALAGVPFKIELLDANGKAVETHYVVTGADGSYSSAALDNTVNTNANDAALSSYGKKDVIPQSVVDSLNANAGLWFGTGTNGSKAAANNSYGSLPYGTYRITELKTEATKTKKMVTKTFTVDKEGAAIDLGEISNISMSVKTTLVDVNESHAANASENLTLVDHVEYKNLDTDKEYTLEGVLYLIDGEAFTEYAKASAKFTPASANGTADVKFTIDASELTGKSLVAYETLTQDGEYCAEHKDKTDEAQTVYFPGVQTNATDSKTGTHVAAAAEDVTIIDTVTYTNLKVGKEYTVNGTLMDKDTGKAMTDDTGNEITASKTFTPETSDGSVQIEFTFSGVSLAGKTTVAFEDLYNEGKRVAVHADIDDDDQTVYFPDITTSAVGDTGVNHVMTNDTVTITDTVSYTNLYPGVEYTISGKLMTQAGEALIAGGKAVTASVNFTPEAKDGTVDVTYTFDASDLGGSKLVVFENLYYGDKLVASHEDLSDTHQTVYVPEIRTTATAENGTHSTEATENITITDTVTYTGLEIGREYTVTGTLVDKATGEDLKDDNGNVITAQTNFTPEAMAGTVNIVFNFSGVSLKGTTMVAFERVNTEGREVAVHADINDEDQTIYTPGIKTTATGFTGDHVEHAYKDTIITDNMELTGLTVGETYVIKGYLMNAETGEPIVDAEGNEVTGLINGFVAEKKDMNMWLSFKFNAAGLEGTKTVVFEELYLGYDGNLVAEHKDLSDEGQTVYLPKIGTSAKDSATGTNHTKADKEVTIIDTVTYTKLLPGKEYTIDGVLYNKETNAPIYVNGVEVTATKTFTPTAENGTVTLEFTFDASALGGTTLVAFETCKYKGIEVAVHADIEDEDQTVYVTDIKTSVKSTLTEDHLAKADEEVTLVDTVTYKGLEVGKEYTLKGVLMDRKTGNELLISGKSVTGETTFTPDKKDGTVDVTFTFNAADIKGKTLVVFETLIADGKEVAEHKDLDDEGQTVYVPEIRTQATDNVTGFNHTEAEETATIFDTVTYTNLLPGKEYTIKGVLYNKATGEPVLDNGKEITGEVTFTPSESSGLAQIMFTFNAKALEGTTVVAFESIEHKGIEVGVHADIEDEDQTVYIPSIKTTAVSTDTEDHVVEAKKDVTITDTVELKGLEVGREYTVKGVLMSKATGSSVEVDGISVESELTFTAEKRDMTVDMTYTFDASALEGTTTVVFETLYTDGVEVGQHHEITDDGQTVYIPKIRTKTEDAVTKINHTEAKSEATVIDTVHYSHLLPGKEYTVSGTLMNKETGEPILDADGKEITASTTFTAEHTAGDVEVTFTFDASVLAGTTLVAYESMTYKGVEIAVHADIEDEGQTQYIAKIGTTALADDTEDHITKADEKATIIDTVAYEGLKAGREYVLKGELMNVKTGEAILDAEGKAVVAETTFTPAEKDGTVDVVFTFDASKLEGTTTVAFETLYADGQEVAVHAEIDDEGQTVEFPKIRTEATDNVTGFNHTKAEEQATIFDTVSYTNLIPGKEYTMKGVLYNKKTGEPVLVDGKEITGETTFTAKESSGLVQIMFTFDASVLEGTTVVAFESCEYKGIEVGAHADIEDEDQTVYIPKIRTTALAEDTNDHVTMADEKITITDIVAYESLEAGREYTVKGVLMDRATGKALEVNGEEVVSDTTFTPKEQDGTVDVVFTFDASAFFNSSEEITDENDGKELVVFETLITEDKEVAEHKDIDDEDQTVYVPMIKTSAEDAVTKFNHTEALEQATIIDTVTYRHLIPGKTYVMKGTLMNKETGEPILIDGKEITAETKFTAEKTEGTVEVTFTFDAKAIEGTTAVAFESCEYEGIEIAVHADIEDEEQTQYIPKVRTTALADDTEDHITKAAEKVTIIDTVAYEGLEAGREYTLKGELMNAKTGEAILDAEGEAVVAETTFTAEEKDGTVEVTFTFDASKLEGTRTVAFETLYTDGVEVGVHADLEDEDQTVEFPKIRTNAKDKETQIDHTEAKTEATVIDTVTYTNLLVGKEYTVNGTLMDKETGEPVLVSGKEITAGTTFTAETADGSVDIVFTFDASILAGKTLVAFEHVEYKGIEVGVHADIEDEDQTIYVPEVKTTAIGTDTKDHIVKAKADASITDTVAYDGLKVGNEYTVKGTLVDKATGEEIGATAETTFTAEAKKGTVDIVFTFDATAYADHTFVAFETLYTEGKEVGVHADIEDEDQTVYVPEIRTTAKDKATGDHDGVVASTTTVVDEVFYKNLIPGREYTVNGTLMVKETGKALVVNGSEVTASKTFVPEEKDGSVIIEFTFDSSALGGTTVVAFEDMNFNGVSVATHADLEDEDQSVIYPSIRTNAADGATSSKTMTLGESVTLIDTVTYTGLTVGKSYVLKGVLMDKASKESTGITAETTFTAESTDGSVNVSFTVNTNDLAGKTLVVFETLCDTNGTEIVEHKDIDDEDQTVVVPEKPVTPPEEVPPTTTEVPPVVTGDNSTPLPYVAALGGSLVLAAGAALAIKKRRRTAAAGSDSENNKEEK